MRFLLSLSIVILAIGCGRPDDGSDVATQRQPLTWSEFVGQAYLEPDTGVYVINGDEPAEDLGALASAYQAYLADFNAERQASQGVGTKRQQLIVHTVGGADAVWVGAAALNITYCIDTKSFGNKAAQVEAALDAAAAEWEATASVNFVYVPAENSKCTTRNNNVVFDVRLVKTPQYLARAFFPNYSRSSRELLISTTAFGNITPWTLTGVLRHELGHAIGFRHEHTRPESGTCVESSDWRALTAYDSASVMHYPQCNGTQTGDLALTALDQQGARALYP